METREQLVARLEQSLNAIWLRAHVCRSGSTLKVVFDRVLDDAQASWPLLACVEVAPDGLRFNRRCPAFRLAGDEALGAARREVVQALVLVLGSLSGRLLTRALEDAVGELDAPAAQAAP